MAGQASSLRRSLPYAVPILVAGLVLAAGGAYAALRQETYESSGRLVITPKTVDPRELPPLLDSVTGSGTLGTYVELITSKDTLTVAGSPSVEVEARAIPDTRVIMVTTRGEERVVRAATAALMLTAQRRAPRLGDPWRVRVLETASLPGEAPPTLLSIILATVALAAFAAVFVSLASRRFLPSQGSNHRSDSTQGPASQTAEAGQPIEDDTRARRRTEWGFL